MMQPSHKRLEELVNKKLDNLLTAAEQAELQKLLASSDEARQYAQKMETIHTQLLSAATEQNTIDVREKIMNRIITSKQTITMKQEKNALWWRTINRQSMKYAAILLIGIMLGASLTYLFTLGRLNTDVNLAKGLMSSHQGNSSYFSGEDWQINANYMIIDKEVDLFVSVRTNNEIQINMQLDPQVFKIINSQCQGCNQAPNANVYSGNVSFSSMGETVYKTQLSYHPGIVSPVRISVSQNGTILYEGDFIIR
ncbi:MAG: hypothetical protein EOM06_07210 [Sphingobacteriia bacterium]|nr:hypothetical protein [Sphingobacteriia bacterium]